VTAAAACGGVGVRADDLAVVVDAESRGEFGSWEVDVCKCQEGFHDKG